MVCLPVRHCGLGRKATKRGNLWVPERQVPYHGSRGTVDPKYERVRLGGKRLLQREKKGGQTGRGGREETQRARWMEEKLGSKSIGLSKCRGLIKGEGRPKNKRKGIDKN